MSGLAPRQQVLRLAQPLEAGGFLAPFGLRTGRDHDESVEATLALHLHSDAAPSPGLSSDDWWALDRHAAPDAAMREGDAWRACDAPVTLAHDAPQVLLSAPTHAEGSLAQVSESRTFARNTRRFIAPRRAPLRN